MLCQNARNQVEEVLIELHVRFVLTCSNPKRHVRDNLVEWFLSGDVAHIVIDKGYVVDLRGARILLCGFDGCS